MEAVKASSTQALQSAQASQRTEQKTQAQAQTTASKQTEEQAPPRPTTNTRGESLGQLLNARA